MEPIPSNRNPCNFSRRFEARLDALPEAQAFLAAALRRNGLAPELVARAELILEELFRNSVLHGYRGDARGSVWLASADAPGAFSYEDEAPPFDPLGAAPGAGGAVPGRPVGEQPVGGVGLLLIRRMARRVEYLRREGRNRLLVRF